MARHYASYAPPARAGVYDLAVGTDLIAGTPFQDEEERRLRSRSLWLDGVPGPLRPRPGLPGDRDCDVAVVGAGLLGLWTAYSLVRADPSLRVVVVEREVAGFGAAGRNAGFVSAGLAGEAGVYERAHGAHAVVRAERAMIDGIDEVGAVIAAEAIDCGWVKGGSLRIATSAPQLERVRLAVATRLKRGWTADDVRLVTAAEIGERIAVAGVRGGSFTPHCARVDPARLARGLADACVRRGVTIYEGTPAFALEPGVVRCATGSVQAPIVVRATESYTVELPGERRRFMPIVSQMIATEPLSPEVWEQLGWAGRETIADQHHLFLYAQRTADDRIALGGGGASYRFGSDVRGADARPPALRGRLESALGRLFPAVAAARVTHAWGGAFAVPRDWSMGVRLDRASGLAVAEGLAGHGVTASCLAGRTLADLILGRDSDIVTLPWVGHVSPRWEPEPIRMLAARTITDVLAFADAREDRTDGTAGIVRLVQRWLAPR